jgi:hypothetical protein
MGTFLAVVIFSIACLIGVAEENREKYGPNKSKEPKK